MTITISPTNIAFVGILIAPLVVWIVLRVLARQFSVDLHPVLPWLRRMQWVGWVTTLVLVLFLVLGATHNNNILPFACACGAVGPGLSLAEGNLKRRFAPDLITTPETDEGWWPSKRN